MRRRRFAILALSGAFYVLQLALIAYSAYLGASYGRPYAPWFVVLIVVTLAAVTVALTRYLLSTLDRAEEAYAAELEYGLEESLSAYLEATRGQERESAEISRAIARELADAREALEGTYADEVDGHLRRGLELASQTARTRCPNTTVAAVLDSKERQCAYAGVALDAQAALPESLPIPDVELASLLFNLIDNALHECRALVEDAVEEAGGGDLAAPAIKLRASVRAGQLLLTVENPCRPAGGPINLLRRRAQTGGLHGWGTEIVQSVTERHGGIAEFRREHERFVARVMIPLA